MTTVGTVRRSVGGRYRCSGLSPRGDGLSRCRTDATQGIGLSLIIRHERFQQSTAKRFDKSNGPGRAAVSRGGDCQVRISCAQQALLRHLRRTDPILASAAVFMLCFC